MSTKTTDKTRARALQQDTGWSYSECLRCVRTMTEDEIDELIERRKRQNVLHGGSQIAEEFGVTPTAICSIIKKRNWKHVE